MQRYKIVNRDRLILLLDLEFHGLDTFVFREESREFRLFESLLHELSHAAVLGIKFGRGVAERVTNHFCRVPEDLRSDKSELRAVAVQFRVMDQLVHPCGRMRRGDILLNVLLGMHKVQSLYKIRKYLNAYKDLPSTHRHAARVLRYVQRLDRECSQR